MWLSAESLLIRSRSRVTAPESQNLKYILESSCSVLSDFQHDPHQFLKLRSRLRGLCLFLALRLESIFPFLSGAEAAPQLQCTQRDLHHPCQSSQMLARQGTCKYPFLTSLCTEEMRNPGSACELYTGPGLEFRGYSACPETKPTAVLRAPL